MTIAVVIFYTGPKKFKPAFISSIYSGQIPSDEVFIQDSIKIHGGLESDYLVHSTNDETIIDRVFSQDEFEGIFDYNSETKKWFVESLSFALEDNKKWVSIETDVVGNKQRLFLDGTSSCLNIISNVYNKDKTTIDTSFNGTICINCITPSKKIIPIEADFINGVHTERFYPTEFGTFIIPESKVRCDDNQYRVIEQLEIKVYYKAE